MKPIIEPFNGEYNYIQYAFIKLISFLVIWSWKCSAMMQNKITILRTSENQVYGTVLNIFPHWISKPCIWKHKNHRKMSSGAGRFSKFFCACKKTQFVVQNCKSGRHNRQLTFKRRKLQHKMTSTDIVKN